MELDMKFAAAEDKHYARMQREWEGRAVEIDEDALEERREKAMWAQIQNDCIEVLCNANRSRYDTLNWLLNRVFNARAEDLEQARDDLLAVIKQETDEYVRQL